MKKPVEGVDELKANLAKLGRLYSQEIVKGAMAGANLVRSDAIKSIQDASSGDTVTRYTANGKPYEHTASEEGSAPNTDTGRLVESIQVEVTGKGIFVGSTLQYAAHLEYGTKIMGARPWLIPATEKNRAEIERLIGKHVKKITDKHGKNL